MGMEGDFLSFSFAGVDSSDLNIVRTSDGDRFDEDLTPEIKDITVEVPGMNGEYFFGSTYGTRTFDVSFAFDSLTEAQFRKLRKVYGRQKQGELIFSERPYKRYIAKIESPIELSYISFDEPKKQETTIYGVGNKNHDVIRSTDDFERIYKGEGKVSFISYFPFAKSCFKVLDTDELKNSDWAVSSGILSQEERETDLIDVYSAGAINVYNAGDVSTGFRLYVPSGLTNTTTLTYNAGVSNQFEEASLVIDPFSLKTGDNGFLINTDSNLIIGVADMSINQDGNITYTTTGNLYNEYVKSGYFFKLQPNLQYDNAQIQITGLSSTPQIFYDYLYF